MSKCETYKKGIVYNTLRVRGCRETAQRIAEAASAFGSSYGLLDSCHPQPRWMIRTYGARPDLSVALKHWRDRCWGVTDEASITSIHTAAFDDGRDGVEVRFATWADTPIKAIEALGRTSLLVAIDFFSHNAVEDSFGWVRITPDYVEKEWFRAESFEGIQSVTTTMRQALPTLDKRLRELANKEMEHQ